MTIAIGQRIHNLTVLNEAETEAEPDSGLKYWSTRCDCGNEKIIEDGALRSGIVANCGCTRWFSRKDNALGVTTGRLTVVEILGGTPKQFLCKCVCGQHVKASAKDICFKTVDHKCKQNPTHPSVLSLQQKVNVLRDQVLLLPDDEYEQLDKALELALLLVPSLNNH
ncbi:hypothetical protein GCM10023116_12580 [Kistimonas scapharcae]|uniref:Uncharacterized protein n=1 Tax=Kistimonas scapharcae TaxID=1036133 RepID=A0ABP8UZ01_9GAMM